MEVWARPCQAEGTVSAKALRQERARTRSAGWLEETEWWRWEDMRIQNQPGTANIFSILNL